MTYEESDGKQGDEKQQEQGNLKKQGADPHTHPPIIIKGGSVEIDLGDRGYERVTSSPFRYITNMDVGNPQVIFRRGDTVLGRCPISGDFRITVRCGRDGQTNRNIEVTGSAGFGRILVEFNAGEYPSGHMGMPHKHYNPDRVMTGVEIIIENAPSDCRIPDVLPFDIYIESEH
jgi:hypothetical protein